jgi:hypothetical protein
MKSPLLANPERLLHAKLMPSRSHSMVIQREDLLAQLDAGLTKKGGVWYGRSFSIIKHSILRT